MPNHSPVPNAMPAVTPVSQVMTWDEAQQPLREGKAIARLAWTGPDEYIQLRPYGEGLDKVLWVHHTGQWHTLIVCENDLTATDWVTADHAVA